MAAKASKAANKAAALEVSRVVSHATAAELASLGGDAAPATAAAAAQLAADHAPGSGVDRELLETQAAARAAALERVAAAAGAAGGPHALYEASAVVMWRLHRAAPGSDVWRLSAPCRPGRGGGTQESAVPLA